MKVLICGGRDYPVWQVSVFLNENIHAITHNNPVTTVIHGAARGADTGAEIWALSQGIPTLKFPADWKRHGMAAGMIRNKQMLAECQPDLVIAFPGGKGTANMIALAKAAGVEIAYVATGGINESAR